ncbi:heterokaryon incompatibility protein-domain-containing protein [Echria macrotheca]|uniref:Heterokaryon incompatibility protein-domain-containing protein n=1 Tax=Echria macrotheca TaxID=438768 RepID=A0AAJ0BGF7_9PEZI|nr:heterokaryon incompatibility protein-domain-containing protein [Echria macrotheca]
MAAQNLTPHSCSHCQSVTIDMRKTKASYAQDDRQNLSWGLPPAPVIFAGFDHQPRADIIADIEYPLNGLLKGSAAGCAFMRWLVEDQKFGEHIPALLGKPEQDGGYRLRVHVEYTSHWDFVYVRWFLLGTWAEGDERFGKNVARTSVGFGVYTLPDDPAAYDISTRPIRVQITPDTFRQARGWMQKCLETHEMCPKPGRTMPTRLVHLVNTQGGPKVRLCKTNTLTDPVPYAALSYCWGGPQPLTLLQSNQSTFLTDGFSLDSLSKSVQDALHTAAELSIPHLWVDSLCIIQDDLDDVAREIAAMPRIYRNAHVTLKASRAKSSADGFLTDRPETDRPHLCFKLSHRGSKHKLGSVVLLSQDEERIDEPLDTRAWALQERILSPRVLDFATRHVGWICRGTSMDKWSSSTDGWRRRIDTNPKLRDISHDVFHRDFPDENALVRAAREIRAGSVLQHWRELLQAYSRRELSFPKDRILAMSGIAETYGSVFRDQYLAGLWRFAIDSELLWALAWNSPRGPRPKEYQGPSWSWAAVSCHIDYRLDLGPGPRRVDDGDLLELVDYQAALESEDAPYGAVKWAHLTVRARMRPAWWMRGSQAPTYSRHDELRIPGEEGKGPGEKMAGTIIPDALEDEFIREEPAAYLPVHLLEVAHYSPGFGNLYGARGVVLRRRDDGLYSRLGFFELYRGGHTFEGYQVQTVTIV